LWRGIKLRIEYLTIFEEWEGNREIEKHTSRRFERDQVYGKTIIEVNEEELSILENANIKFVKL
jgi:hypothetical protein